MPVRIRIEDRGSESDYNFSAAWVLGTSPRAPSKLLPQIDAIPTMSEANGQPCLGVYEFCSDGLRCCLATPGQAMMFESMPLWKFVSFSIGNFGLAC